MSNNPHFLVMPYPILGHMNPLLQFSYVLIKHGCRITFVISEFIEKRVKIPSDDDVGSSKMINFVTLPDGLDPEDDRSDQPKVILSMRNTMPPKLHKLIQDINNGENKIRCILVSKNIGWALEVGNNLGIKGSFLWPASATSLASYYSIQSLIDQGIIDSQTVGMSAEVTGLPNLFQTFLCASDDEGDNEKSAAEKSAALPEDKAATEQEAAVDGTGTSAQAAQVGVDKTVHASPFREVIGTGGSTSNPDADDEVEEVPSLKRKRKTSSSPEGVLTVMERNFDAGNFIDSQLIPGTEEYFHESSLAGQARWMYRTLLRGAVIARKAEFELSGMESLRRRLESTGKAKNELKSEVETLREQLTQSNEKLDAAEKKATAAEKKAATAEKKLEESGATVSRLVDREMALESQVGEAQKRVADIEKEKQTVEAELATWKAKYKDVVKQGKGAILATEEALKAQVKIVAPEFDTSAISVFKVIKDGKIVDVPKK
nr:uncharacterized protein LOC112797852 isoform X1 [Arachis hypogaea]